jgi:uncharacterized membrane protein YfcA
LLDAKLTLFAALGLLALGFVGYWIRSVRGQRRDAATAAPTALQLGIGFVTNFFDTLGIGSFAPTTAIFKLRRLVADEQIPGTLNVGHALPVIVQAFIFIAIVEVEIPTLVSMIVAAVLGAWIGAGVVAGLPRRRVQIGMGCALLAAATFFAMTNLGLFPSGGNTLGLTSPILWIGIVGIFLLGALNTVGIGLYAPCMILVALLGMNPKAAFPIMMGSCAFLMPVASVRFIRKGSYSLWPAIGLTVGGLPAVLIAAFVVKSLPLTALRWLVVAVVAYAALAMLRSARMDRAQSAMISSGDDMRVPLAEYLSLRLRAHELLRDVPLYDVSVVDLPGGGSGRSVADIRVLEASTAPSRIAIVLFDVRRFLGRVFGWDRNQVRPEESLLPRLSERDRSDSEIAPGTPVGAFLLIYQFPDEALAEIRNATVHGWVCTALARIGAGYRLYWAVYVLPVSWLTRPYLALIEPFRRILYPAMLRRIRRAWLAAYAAST